MSIGRNLTCFCVYSGLSRLAEFARIPPDYRFCDFQDDGVACRQLEHLDRIRFISGNDNASVVPVNGDLPKRGVFLVPPDYVRPLGLILIVGYADGVVVTEAPVVSGTRRVHVVDDITVVFSLYRPLCRVFVLQGVESATSMHNWKRLVSSGGIPRNVHRSVEDVLTGW